MSGNTAVLHYRTNFTSWIVMKQTGILPIQSVEMNASKVWQGGRAAPPSSHFAFRKMFTNFEIVF